MVLLVNHPLTSNSKPFTGAIQFHHRSFVTVPSETTSSPNRIQLDSLNQKRFTLNRSFGWRPEDKPIGIQVFVPEIPMGANLAFHSSHLIAEYYQKPSTTAFSRRCQ